MAIELISIIVEDYDAAIAWFTNVLGFSLVEDAPSLTNDGRAKRWVVVRPPDAETGILLAKADGDVQRAAIGAQFAGRVGLFLRVEDFEGTLARLREASAEIVTVPRDEAYGRVVVFRDLCGNKWDLLGPRP
jgi:catechol 2,3-dioxygenase-like lactoylglutathione lyase family enzyme